MLRKILLLPACAIFIFLYCFSVGTLAAETVFLENFEGGLLKWTGKYGEPQDSGLIVEDPYRPGNSVLKFHRLTFGGAFFSEQVKVVPGKTYVLSFEYLGMPSKAGTLDDLGGFVGFADDIALAGQHTGPDKLRWLAGTKLCCGAEDDPLVDDGQWQTFSVRFDPFRDRYGESWTIKNNTIRVVLEDFWGSGGIAGDVYFDNIKITE